MKSMKKTIALLLALVMVFALAGCGSSSSTTTTDSTASAATEAPVADDTAADDTAADTSADASAEEGFNAADWGSNVQAIVDSGVLKVGCKSDVIGFGYMDILTNEYEGLEIDIAYLIADYMGIDDVEFTTVTAATRGELLDSGALDCVIATFTITDERRESWDFTTAYYTDYVSLLVENESGITTLADLVGTTIGVSSGSTSAKKLVEEMIDQGIIDGSSYDSDTFDPATWTEGVSFQQYDDYPAISTGLAAGEVSAFCVDRSILAAYLTSSRSYMDAEFAPQEYGIATRLDSDFSDLVEYLITTWLDDGTIDGLIDKWGL